MTHIVPTNVVTTIASTFPSSGGGIMTLFVVGAVEGVVDVSNAKI